MADPATTAAEPTARGCHCGRPGCTLGPPANLDLQGYLSWAESIEYQDLFTPPIMRWALERARAAAARRENGPLGPLAYLRNGSPVEYVRHEPAHREPRSPLTRKR